MKETLKQASDEKLPEGLLERTMQKLEPEMQRRAALAAEAGSPWLTWLKFGLPTMALAGAAAAVVIVLRTHPGSEGPGELALRGAPSIELLEESEVIAELDLLRSMKVLERLEESDTWRKIEAKAKI